MGVINQTEKYDPIKFIVKPKIDFQIYLMFFIVFCLSYLFLLICLGSENNVDNEIEDINQNFKETLRMLSEQDYPYFQETLHIHHDAEEMTERLNDLKKPLVGAAVTANTDLNNDQSEDISKQKDFSEPKTIGNDYGGKSEQQDFDNEEPTNVKVDTDKFEEEK